VRGNETSARAPARRGYRRRAVPGRQSAGLLGALLVVFGSPSAAANQLPVHVLAVPAPELESGTPLVALLVEVPGASLRQGAEAGRIDGEIWAIARDRTGATADAFVEPFAVTLDAEPVEGVVGPGARTGLKLVGVLRLAPGSYQVQVTVTVATAASSLVGSVASAIEVPDFAADEALVSPPLFPESVNGWRVLRQSGTTLRSGLPFELLGEGFLPRAVVETPLGAPLGFHLISYRVTDLEASLDARLVDLEGGPVPVSVTVEQQEAGPAPGQLVARLAMHATPPEPGVYWLDLGLSGGGKRVQVPLRMVAPSPASPPSVVESVVSTVADGDLLPEGAAEQDYEDPDYGDRSGAAVAAEMAGRYREALATYAGGDPERAVGLLEVLESAAAVRPRTFEQLRKSQRRVLEELRLERGLLSVIHLHSLLARQYVTSRSASLAAQNRVFVAELVDRWVKAERGDDAREVGALVLAELGASHQALEVDPASRLALLRLAIEAEKSWQLESALGYLLRLLEVAPAHSHARLRLGIVLGRLDRNAESSSVLRSLTSADATAESSEVPRWVVALAFQELASLERDAGQLGRAVATLRRGIEATGVQALRLQLGFYLDLQQRRIDAESVLDGLELAETGVETAPRHRYNGQPEAELAAARERIVRAVASRSQRLETLLGNAGRERASSQ
jgi:hypothetical protein